MIHYRDLITCGFKGGTADHRKSSIYGYRVNFVEAKYSELREKELEQADANEEPAGYKRVLIELTRTRHGFTLNSGE